MGIFIVAGTVAACVAGAVVVKALSEGAQWSVVGPLILQGVGIFAAWVVWPVYELLRGRRGHVKPPTR